jgi:erythromycin esterase
MQGKVKYVLITIFIIFHLFTLFGCKIENAEASLTQQEELILELNGQLIPLNASPLELADNALDFLDLLQDARIVGLGEATHGTREFFQMKHRIFRYLVEHWGHKAIGFEADFAESVYINMYITGTDADLETLMKTVMQYWTWKTTEVKELLQWMRSYNSGKTAEEQVFYFGLDCQSTQLQPGLMRDYFLRTVPFIWQTAQPLMVQISSMSSYDYQHMPDAEYNILLARVESLENRMENEKAQLIAASSTREYELYRQVLHTFWQAFTLRYYLETGYGSYTRDLYMAKNALWLADFLGDNARVSLWAHNGHVAKDPEYLGSGSMGFMLYEALNDNYLAIGFGFSQGSFTAQGEDSSGQLLDANNHQINSEPLANSVNYLWHQAAHKNFVFIPDAFGSGSGWDNWMSSARPYLMIGSSYDDTPEDYYRPTDIRYNYDMIIYFDHTEASKLL